MKYCTYIYGRTLNIDFREICSPQGGLSPKSISLIEQLINTDVVSNGEINRLRYLFVREQQQVLFGVGFNHRQYLGKNHWTDLTGKRGLRSFVGIVIDNEEFDKLTSIPTDYGFYMDLYLKHISDVWELEDRPKNRKVIISHPETAEQSENWCQLDGNLVFNSDDRRCSFFAPTEEDSLIHSIKNCHSSVAIGLNVESHVSSAYKRFNVAIPNALCLDTQINHDEELGVSRPINENNRHDGQSSQRTEIVHEKKEINTGNEPDANDSTQGSAILSELQEYDPSSNGNTVQKHVQNNDLMNFDWGEVNTPEPPKVPDDVPNNDQSEETLEERNDDLKEGDSDPYPEDGMNTDEKPKKDFRPKLILIAVCILAAILLIVVICTKKIRKSEHSTSGEKTLKQTVWVLKNSTSDSAVKKRGKATVKPFASDCRYGWHITNGRGLKAIEATTRSQIQP